MKRLTMLFHPDDYRNKPKALDLYAIIEEMTEIGEVAPTLYEKYLEKLQKIEFNSLLDLGCGNGDFLAGISKIYPNKRLLGIDLSPKMVERAKSKGVEAKAIDICQLDESFDVITAIFDMVNYIPPFELEDFMKCVYNRLNSGGYFIFDINTLYGFEEVSNGSLIVDEGDRFLAIDGEFAGSIHQSKFTLFTKSNNNLYQKEQESIMQFYHSIDELVEASNMEMIEIEDIELYSDRADKTLIILKKS